VPLPTRVFLPDFALLQKSELNVLFNVLRVDRCTVLYLLLVSISKFSTGEVPLIDYHFLEEVMTPPSREKGGRAKGPTARQIGYAIEQLIEQGLVKRDAAKNTARGELRLFVKKRKKTA